MAYFQIWYPWTELVDYNDCYKYGVVYLLIYGFKHKVTYMLIYLCPSEHLKLQTRFWYEVA